MLAASGKLSTLEYYQALERMTDNTGVALPKVCLCSFICGLCLTYFSEPIQVFASDESPIRTPQDAEAGWSRGYEKWSCPYDLG